MKHFTANWPALAILKKAWVFFGKTHLFFSKKNKFWTFREILLLQSHSTANLLLKNLIIRKCPSSPSKSNINYQLANNRLKNISVEWMTFLLYFKQKYQVVACEISTAEKIALFIMISFFSHNRSVGQCSVTI